MAAQKPSMNESGPTPSPSEQPATFWGKLLAATPVVMTVAATLLAGLSSSEMIRAQYDRSLASQQQAKIGDQWGFFQAKRLRGTSLRANLQLLQATTDLAPLDLDVLRPLAGAAGAPVVDALARGELPSAKPQAAAAADLRAALEAVGAGRTDEEVMQVLGKVAPEAVAAAIRSAQQDARSFEALISPITRGVEELEQRVSDRPSVPREAARSLARSFTAARLRYDAVRYDAEARYNRVIAELYDLQVRQSNSSADRHYLRSERFFYGMLGAQAAVILASFALAVQRRNLLWGFAAMLGLAAVAFSVYVYLCL